MRRLVAAQGGVETLGPSFDTAGDVAYARESLGAEILGDAQAAAAVVAVDEEMFVARQRGDALRDLAQRNRLGAGDGADFEFVGLADVDEDGVAGRGGEESLSFFDRNFERDGGGGHGGGDGVGGW